jgi:hypothetical protein
MINGTVRDWMYFLVDGIYPDWAIFVKTIPEAARIDPQQVFFQVARKLSGKMSNELLEFW